jgi:hypothetical protein
MDPRYFGDDEEQSLEDAPSNLACANPVAPTAAPPIRDQRPVSRIKPMPGYTPSNAIGDGNLRKEMATVSTSPVDNRKDLFAAHNADEQKLWIQCTLKGGKQRGEDWIEADFTEDNPTGCSACLPDVVIANNAEAVKEFMSKNAPFLPWQQIENRVSKEHVTEAPTPPIAANIMPISPSNSENDNTSVQPSCCSDTSTFLYNHKRFERASS